MSTTVYLDCETYNDLDLKRYGTYRYAQTCELTLLGLLIDRHDGKPLKGPIVWDATTDRPLPDTIIALLSAPDTALIAHNAQFDRTVLHNTIGLSVDPSRWRCTMAQALSASYPGALAKLGRVLDLDEDKQKTADGRRLMLKFCKPAPKNRKVKRYDRHNCPEEWVRFIEYCRQDVVALREIHRILPDVNYTGDELALWHLDQKINDRGYQVDRALVRGALEACQIEKERVGTKLYEKTQGAVETVGQRDKIIAYCKMLGTDIGNLRKATVERYLNDPETPEPVRELLALRQQGGKTSVTKYAILARTVNPDGRVRGSIQFCGAMRTGRFAGRMFQPHNLPRTPTYDGAAEEIAWNIGAMRARVGDLVLNNVLEDAAFALRGAIIAKPGHKLVVSDLKNIEGRGLPWLAGEEWKLKAFEAFDAGTGHDIYNLAYSSSFGVEPIAVNKDNRQIGKVQELALGYAGGVGAFSVMAAGYGVDMEAAFPGIWQRATDKQRSVARKAWARDKNKVHFSEISAKAYVASDIVKQSWRSANSKIVKFWYATEDAVTFVLANPEEVVAVGLLQFYRSERYLHVVLPSGRELLYHDPKIEHGDITYMGVNQYTRQWGRIKSYGGKFVENITQAVARDVLTHGMVHVEKAGYLIVLTVHDEIICEVPDTDEYSVEGLNELLATNPPWAEGLPLAASGFEAKRYRKD